MNKIFMRKNRTNTEMYQIKLYSDNESQFIFAGFSNVEQLKNFFDLFEIKPDLAVLEIYNKDEENELTEFVIDWHFVSDNISFWDLSEVPADAKKIKALSNGSIVDCYYTKNDNIITLYRPNPNAKKIYNPLNTAQHIAYQKLYGSF